MRRPAILLGLAMVIALVTGALILRYLSEQQRATPAAKPQIAKVVVAAEDIPFGTSVKEAQVQTVTWPQEHRPPESISDPSLVVGKRARVQIPKGLVIVPRHHVVDERHGPMTIAIPKGQRAMSVRVNDVTSISGFVMPGSRVDVVVTLKRPGGTREARTLLQNVLVLAVEQETQAQDTALQKVDTVTLLVSPSDAEQLTLAATEGQIQLALRGYSDKAFTPTAGASLDELLDGPAVAQPAPLEPEPLLASTNGVEVEVIRGSDRVVQSF